MAGLEPVKQEISPNQAISSYSHILFSHNRISHCSSVLKSLQKCTILHPATKKFRQSFVKKGRRISVSPAAFTSESQFPEQFVQLAVLPCQVAVLYPVAQDVVQLLQQFLFDRILLQI